MMAPTHPAYLPFPELVISPTYSPSNTTPNTPTAPIEAPPPYTSSTPAYSPTSPTSPNSPNSPTSPAQNANAGEAQRARTIEAARGSPNDILADWQHHRLRHALREYNLTQDPSNWGTRKTHPTHPQRVRRNEDDDDEVEGGFLGWLQWFGKLMSPVNTVTRGGQMMPVEHMFV